MRVCVIFVHRQCVKTLRSLPFAYFVNKKKATKSQGKNLKVRKQKSEDSYQMLMLLIIVL